MTRNIVCPSLLEFQVYIYECYILLEFLKDDLMQKYHCDVHILSNE